MKSSLHRLIPFLPLLSTQFYSSALRLISRPACVSKSGSTRLCYRAEQSRVVAYCRQSASTVTPGIEPSWDHGHIFVQCQDFCFFFRSSSFDKKGGAGHGPHGKHRLLLSHIVLGVFTASLHSNGCGGDHIGNSLSIVEVCLPLARVYQVVA
jgi:hypothetical protein